MSSDLHMCCRCYDEVEETFPTNCKEKPEEINGAIGMYHCPDCGAMVVAGLTHGELCEPCLKREKKGFDE